MDARQIIFDALFDAHYDASVSTRTERVIEALHNAGYSILHDSENHGPTLERAAERGDEIAKRDFSASYRCGASDTSAAIRAMEVKHNG